VAEVVLDHVTKVRQRGVRDVADVSLEVPDGELLALVGPTGSGTSTVLRVVAGLDEVTSGEVRIGGRRVNEQPPHERDAAMVFPGYALFPHLDVEDNLALGLRMRRLPKAEAGARIQHAARLLDLDGVLGRRPSELSASQRQRVALGRAVVRQPAVYLLDEPLLGLDPALRAAAKGELGSLQRDLGATVIHVTHDPVEAMTIGDRVAVMSKGMLLQVATPQTVYDEPDNLFVAGFIGSPPMNVAVATVRAVGTGLAIEVGSQTLAVDQEVVAERPALRNYLGDRVAVGIRAEDLHDTARGAAAPPDERLRAVVQRVEALGPEVLVHFGVDAPRAVAEGLEHSAADGAWANGGAGAGPSGGAPTGMTAFAARFPPRSQVRVGDPLEVAVDTSRLHFFDLTSGQAIRA
jgi:multiple sugar transport system ATP-binding protein